MNLRVKLICAMLALCLFSTAALAGAILKFGSESDDVLALQLRLIELGYGQSEQDGVFGKGTEQALMEFQRNNDLLVTGMADEVTVRVLMSDDAVSWQEYVFTESTEFEDGFAAAGLSVFSKNSGMAFETGEPAPAAFNTREYTVFSENGFQSTLSSPLSTFAADVDTASWTQIRQMALRGEKVPPDSVRIEEMLNYFHYDYKTPEHGEPFGVTMEMDACPWNEETKLLLIGLQAAEIEKESEAPKNLVFLIDVSGSMDEPEKLPLVKRSFLNLMETLNPEDTISIVTYASSDTIVIEGVSASEKTRVMEAINELEAGGGTNGSQGIVTAYELAKKYFVKGGVNRILLATDGDLNIGVTGEGDLARLVSDRREEGVSMTVLGFGGWNYKDNRMEALADYGDGNYWYIDSLHEARRALIVEGGGTFRTVAKDVKLQLDFNPAYIKGYRLIGYEDRLLNAEEFADDTVDGGEIGSGHRVTALYEIVPADSGFDFGEARSRYAGTAESDSTEWLTLSVRAKEPDGDESALYVYPMNGEADAPAGENLRFASGVAELGMLLRGSKWVGTSSLDAALELLRGCESVTGDVYKEELIYLVSLIDRNDLMK